MRADSGLRESCEVVVRDWEGVGEVRQAPMPGGGSWWPEKWGGLTGTEVGAMLTANRGAEIRGFKLKK